MLSRVAFEAFYVTLLILLLAILKRQILLKSCHQLLTLFLFVADERA